MDEFIISTRPPVGGKRVRRKKPIVVKKKRSAFKKRAAKQGKIIFDTQKAQRSRLRGRTTRQLQEEIQNNFANEVGRQDGGIMGGFGRQQPIVVNLGGQQQADDRVREVRRRMDINNLTTPDQYRPEDFIREVREGIRRQNEADLRQTDVDVEVPDFRRREASSTSSSSVPPQGDFGDVDIFESGFSGLDVSIPERQPEPEVEFRGASGDAAEVLSQISGGLSSSSSEGGRRGFTAADLPLNRRGFDVGGGGSGLDPTAVEYLFDTPAPSETSVLTPLADAADIEEGRNRPLAGVRSLLSNIGGAVGSRVGQLARAASRGGGSGDTPYAETGEITGDAIFVDNPYLAGSDAGSIGFDTP